MLAEDAPSERDQERDQWIDQLLTRPDTDADTQLSHVQFFFDEYEEELDEDQVTAIKNEMVRCLREKEQSRTNAIHEYRINAIAKYNAANRAVPSLPTTQHSNVAVCAKCSPATCG